MRKILFSNHFGKSMVGNEKFAMEPAKEVSQILTVYSIESNQYIYNAWNILEGEYSR